jgi:hypothetical protein
MAKKRLSRVDTSELLSELNRRRRSLPGLKKKRAKLARELAEVDEQIEALGGAAAAAPRGRRGAGTRAAGTRAANKMSLPEAMTKAMSKTSPMSIKDITTKVQELGYISTSENFSNIVSQTLSKDDRFEKVSRGQYKLA